MKFVHIKHGWVVEPAEEIVEEQYKQHEDWKPFVEKQKEAEKRKVKNGSERQDKRILQKNS